MYLSSQIFRRAWLCRQEVEMMVSVTFGCPFFPAYEPFINAGLKNLVDIFRLHPDPTQWARMDLEKNWSKAKDSYSIEDQWCS